MNIARFIPGFFKRLIGQVVLTSYLIGLGASMVLGGGFYAFAQGGTQTQAATSSLAQVERQTIVSSVKATGEVTFANEQELRFNQKGKVTNVYFKEGERVTKGQRIAQLDTSFIAADIRQAELTLAASNLQLQQQQKNKEKQLLDSQNTVKETERQISQTQSDLQLARSTTVNGIAASERSVSEKEAALDAAKRALVLAENEDEEENDTKELAVTLENAMGDANQLLDTVFKILQGEDEVRRPAATLNTNKWVGDQINQAEFGYYGANNAFNDIRSRYGSTFVGQTDENTLVAALSDVITLARNLQTGSDAIYGFLQTGSPSPNEYTDADVNVLKDQARSARDSALTLLGSLQTTQTTWGEVNDPTALSRMQQEKESALKDKQNAVKNAENSLALARESLSALQAKNPVDLQKQADSIDALQDTLVSRESAVRQTESDTDINLKLKQNDIAQKAASLAKTRKTVEDYQLKAPFDGVIRRLDYQVGDNLLDTGEDKFVVLENPDFLVVTILLDQVDIVRVRKEMPAQITLDALPGTKFQGTIDEINSTPVQESGVVSYEVAIRMPTPKDLNILSGMTSTVEIETMRKENVLVVPNLALRRTNGQTSVTRPDGQSVTVEVGATDGRFTEILSGLQEGESVLSMNVTTSQGTQGNADANPAQLFRMGGGGGLAPTGGGGRGGNFQR